MLNLNSLRLSMLCVLTLTSWISTTNNYLLGLRKYGIFFKHLALPPDNFVLLYRNTFRFNSWPLYQREKAAHSCLVSSMKSLPYSISYFTVYVYQLIN